MRLEGFAQGLNAKVNIYWQWFSGQGAFAEVKAALENIKSIPNTPNISCEQDLPFLRKRWKELWPVISFDVASQMKHPSSKAVIAHQHLDNPTTHVSLWLSHPGCSAPIEVRALVTPVHTYSRDELARGSGPLYTLNDLDLEMPVKFWDPDFAAAMQKKKPLPNLPLATGVPEVKIEGHRWKHAVPTKH